MVGPRGPKEQEGKVLLKIKTVLEGRPLGLKARYGSFKHGMVTLFHGMAYRPEALLL